MRNNKYLRTTGFFDDDDYLFCNSGEDTDEQLKYECYDLDIAIAAFLYSRLMAFADCEGGCPYGKEPDEFRAEIREAANGFKRYIELNYGEWSLENDREKLEVVGRSLDWLKDNLPALWW